VDGHALVTKDEWLVARRELLQQEKEFTRRREELSAARRALPWEAVTEAYAFDTPHGSRTLAELFDGRSQLVVYHFMFDPAWDEGCPHCSFWADSFDGIDVHLHARDVTFVAVSRAPLAKLEAYRARMGWRFPWFSSAPSDFNRDFGVTFAPGARETATYNYGTQAAGMGEREGISVFARGGDGALFHTYSTYARGIDMVNGAYQFLDLVPKGRDEPHDGAEGPQFWVRRHDEYGT